MCVAGRAGAQEYCVACDGPPAIYRCIIEGARPGGVAAADALRQLRWPSTAATRDCGVKGGTVFDCDGPVKRVPWSAQGEGAAKGLQPAAHRSRPATTQANRHRRWRRWPTGEPENRRADQEGHATKEQKTRTLRREARRRHQEDVALHHLAVHAAAWSRRSRLSGSAATRGPGAALRRSRTWSSRARSPCGSAWLPRCRALPRD